jgi:HTH-type transcriptional regulator/antitoxin HigA
MDFSSVKAKAVDFFAEAGFISRIRNETDYEQALALMDELIEDYDLYRPLIEVLSSSIEKWENDAEQFSDFNRRIEDLDGGVAVLKILMDQYRLGAGDLADEIGSTDQVLEILNGTRNLTREQIQSLSNRFHVAPSAFFETQHP